MNASDPADSQKQEEDRFRQVVHGIHDYAIMLMDRDGRILTWNEGAERILGYARDEVVGQMGDLFFTEQDREKGLFAHELRLATNEGRATDENWLLRKDGSRFWASGVNTALYDGDGSVRGFVKILRDLTKQKNAELALKESELRLRSALSSARMGTWLWDILEDRQMLDESLLRLLGLQPGQQVGTLEEFIALIHPDDRSAVREVFHRACEEGADFSVEFRVPIGNGNMRWLRDQGDAVAGPDGRLVYLTGACIDITERKQVEKSLLDSEERLRQSNLVLEQRVRERTSELQKNAEQLRFLTAELARAEQKERRRLASVLHDHVQQLLVAARFRVEILSDQTADLGEKKSLDNVAAILNDAIDAARSLSVELSPPLLHDQGLPVAMSWLASRMKDRHGLNVDVRAQPDANPESEDQRDFLFHAARELLLNVVKHARTDAATVRLQRDENAMRLEVIDRGVGFDQNQLRRDSFGLFHLQQRLAALGGELGVESKPGEGTRVLIVFPLNHGTRETIAPRAANESTTPQQTEIREKVRVLVVDDHQIVREGLVHLLMLEPWMEVVGEAADGRTAIERAQSLHPDLVLMDVSMPVMGGIEAARRITSEMPDIRVIGLSLYNEEETAQAMLQAGAVGYVTKTRATRDLVHTIRSLVLRSQA